MVLLLSWLGTFTVYSVDFSQPWNAVLLDLHKSRSDGKYSGAGRVEGLPIVQAKEGGPPLP